MYCVKCGTEVQNNATFCPSCGNKLNNIVVDKQLSINKKQSVNKAITIICSIVIITIIVITGIVISQNNNDSIVGSWADSNGDIRFSFYEDGTCDGGQGPYYEAAENGTITFYDSYHYPYSNITYYEVKGNKLYLSGYKDFDINDENIMVFYRK